jgi:hypothetical protein
MHALRVIGYGTEIRVAVCCYVLPLACPCLYFLVSYGPLQKFEHVLQFLVSWVPYMHPSKKTKCGQLTFYLTHITFSKHGRKIFSF